VKNHVLDPGAVKGPQLFILMIQSLCKESQNPTGVVLAFITKVYFVKKKECGLPREVKVHQIKEGVDVRRSR